MHEDLEIELIGIIAKATSKEKRTYIIVGFVIICIGGIMLWSGYKENPALIIISLLLIVTGLKLLYDKINEPSGFRAPIVLHLVRNKNNMVWVYSIVKENMPFGVRLVENGRVIFKTLDKREYSLSIPIQELTYLSQLLESYLPHTTFGYSKEKENIYEIDPHLLWRAEEGK